VIERINGQKGKGRKMIDKIGIDLHGVIDSDVGMFKELLETLYMSTFITIHIISGPPVKDVQDELDKLGLKIGKHYHYIASVVDYLKTKDTRMWLDHKDTWWADDKDWWGAKAAICEKLDIDIMIDDQEGYKKSFEEIKTHFLLYTG